MKTSQQSAPKIVLGRNEKITFVDLGLKNIPAKTDTGADSSAIHCKMAEIIEQDGKPVLHCILLDERFEGYRKEGFYFEKFKTRKIKNSFGKSQKRFIVNLNVEIHGKTLETAFSLSNRSKMKLPVLLGRRLLKNGFLVDVSIGGTAGQKKNNK